MKITIDTSHDSLEELQHAHSLLGKLVEHRTGGSVNLAAEEAPQPQEGIFSIFNDDTPQQQEAEEAQGETYALFSDAPKAGEDIMTNGPNGHEPEQELQKEDFNVGGYELEAKDEKLQAYF